MKRISTLNKFRNAKRQQGFTLIEIAIVLVIIGLLLGGVLQGQQLIENSRVKSATNDINGITAGAFSYQDRYGRLPGDDPEALAARGTSWTAGAAGDGNGIVDDATDVFAPTATDETAYFFQNLRSAGFINGDPNDTGATALPANPFGGSITIMTGPTLLNGPAALTGPKVCLGGVSGTGAIALDTQLDDGNSVSGRMRALDDTGVANTAPAPTDNAATAYSEDSSYTVCYRL